MMQKKIKTHLPTSLPCNPNPLFRGNPYYYSLICLLPDFFYAHTNTYIQIYIKTGSVFKNTNSIILYISFCNFFPGDLYMNTLHSYNCCIAFHNSTWYIPLLQCLSCGIIVNNIFCHHRQSHPPLHYQQIELYERRDRVFGLYSPHSAWHIIYTK